MERLFKEIPLEGAYLKAFEEAKKELNVNEQEAELLESIVGLVQLIATCEKLPLELELAQVKDEARKLKATVNALTEANKKLEIENRNLLVSLKALKEISIAEDRIKAVSPTVTTLEFRK